MINASDIHKYGIIWVRPAVYSVMDDLLNDTINDPLIAADEVAANENLKFWDTTVLICEEAKIEVQLIAFKNKQGHQKYIDDNVLIFDDNQ